MTENDTTDTMADVSHTNPSTGETAGRLFNRGPIVAADGGKPAATESDEADETDEADGSTGTETDATMRDVDHTPPHRADDANRVFERGVDHERRTDRDTVVEE
ncbi:hypothetical protein [Natrinema salifodinae]|uniref:Uncharacterized protein n=1 Tax=Natrinema salifodinae TaxID=1202768 RepID=A0A1I0P9E6_9EURY|nr:hypothetical protein [Natrinema salifodinae]SEW10841.1 hypothetical protein SAMN05216285_2293 [Natrinema salifodinae]